MDTKELKRKICKEYGVRPSAVSIYQNDNGTFVQMYNASVKKIFYCCLSILFLLNFELDYKIHFLSYLLETSHF